MAMKSLIPLPSHLASFDAKGYVPGEPVAQFELGRFRNFVYLVLDETSKKAALIDCSSENTPALEALAKTGCELESLIITHSHHDHVDGVESLLKLFPKCQIAIHSQELHRTETRWKDYQTRIRPIEDQMVVSVGSHQLKAWHTPGHSSGELCFELHAKGRTSGEQIYFFTGDTLFIGDCGRTDFETGSNEEMFASLQKMKRWPEQSIVLPGHHYVKACASVLAHEFETNQALLCQSVDELARLA
jgi:hydroxyacylglutathione hydrolase